jgi:hypothetical protein
MFTLAIVATVLFSAQADALPGCLRLHGHQNNACRRLEQILPMYPDLCLTSTWLEPYCSACGHCEDVPHQKQFPQLNEEQLAVDSWLAGEDAVVSDFFPADSESPQRKCRAPGESCTRSIFNGWNGGCCNTCQLTVGNIGHAYGYCL